MLTERRRSRRRRVLVGPVVAGMSGMLFIAIVIRIGLTCPPIIFQCLWDGIPFLMNFAVSLGRDVTADLSLQANLGASLFI